MALSVYKKKKRNSVAAALPIPYLYLTCIVPLPDLYLTSTPYLPQERGCSHEPATVSNGREQARRRSSGLSSEASVPISKGSPVARQPRHSPKACVARRLPPQLEGSLRGGWGGRGRCCLRCCVHTLPDFDREREQLEAGVGGRESGVDGMGEWRIVETFMENR